MYNSQRVFRLGIFMASYMIIMLLGAEGKVDESLAVLAEVETLKTKKKEAEVSCGLFMCKYHVHNFVCSKTP